MLLCRLHILKKSVFASNRIHFFYSLKFVQFEYFTRRKKYGIIEHIINCAFLTVSEIYCKILNWYFSQIAKQKEGPHDDKHTPHHRRMSLYAAEEYRLQCSVP